MLFLILCLPSKDSLSTVSFFTALWISFERSFVSILSQLKVFYGLVNLERLQKILDIDGNLLTTLSCEIKASKLKPNDRAVF